MRVTRLLPAVFPWNPRFRVAPVVREKQDQRVLQHLPLPQRGHQFPQVLVHLFDHGRIDRHHIVVTFLLVCSKRIPRGDFLRTRFHLPLWIDQAQIDLPGQSLLAQPIPTLPIFAAVFGDGRFGRHAGKVRCDMCQIPEKRLVVRQGFVDELDPLFRPQIGAIPGWLKTRVLPRNLLAVEKQLGPAFRSRLVAKVQPSCRQIQTPVKPALAGRDAVIETHVPLAGHRREVTGRPQHFGNRDTLVIQPPAISR